MFTAFVAALAIGVASPCASASAGQSDAAVEQELRAKDQALIERTTPRDRPFWEATLTPDAVLLDENGQLFSRADMISQLADFPANVSIKTTMTDYRLRRAGDVATVIHTDAETESFHGQVLHARYLTSETWIRTPGGWRVLMIHIFAAPTDPPAMTLPAGDLAQIPGHYRAGPDLVYDIRMEGGKLVGGRAGTPGKVLSAELKDVFFIAGQPRIRKIFQRDAAGHIIGFVDRREGRDLVWRRTA